MHPAVRIAAFLVFTAALSFGRGAQLLLGFLVLGAVLLPGRGAGLRAAGRMLRRLKWLLLSILVLYLWFTPGEPLWPEWSASWMPSQQGLWLAAVRTGTLVLVVSAASLLVASTPRSDLLGALYWLARPLRRVGFSPERLVLRLALTLEAVQALQVALPDAYRAQRLGRSRLRAAAETAAAAFTTAVQRAETAPCVARSLHVPPPPRALEWLLPLALAALFAGLELL